MINIAVFTCAKYSVLIPKWLTFFERTFPLPYHLDYIVAGTNTIQVPKSYNADATHFMSCKDNGFAANMLDYMRDKTEPVMMMMDDHILFEADKQLLIFAQYMINEWKDVGCMRLVPWPGPTLQLSDSFGEIDKALEYAISLQASFWRPQTLIDLIDPKWNPWQIELEGSKRAAIYDKRFIGCKTCAVNYKDYFMRGNPRPEHAEWVDSHL